MSRTSLSRKTAIVTGSGRGIGAAVAVELARAETNVVVNYVNNFDAADAVRQEIESIGAAATVARADVSTAQGADALVAAAKEQYGGVDILVNNAGPLFQPTPIVEMTWEDFGGTVEQDARSAFFSTKAVLPGMIEQRYGRIVYIGSMSAVHTTPGVAHHGAGRAAITAFARYVAAEAGPHGITANVVAPGMVRTDRTAAAGKAMEKVAAATPIGRAATPVDVARAVRYFAADADGFITGTVLPVDGGLNM